MEMEKSSRPKYGTLFDVMPEHLIPDRDNAERLINQAKEFLISREKNYATPDEVNFVAVLDRYIEIFEKAKGMLAAERFTVEFKGSMKVPDIADFEIQPIRKKPRE